MNRPALMLRTIDRALGWTPVGGGAGIEGRRSGPAAACRVAGCPSSRDSAKRRKCRQYTLSDLEGIMRTRLHVEAPFRVRTRRVAILLLGTSLAVAGLSVPRPASAAIAGTPVDHVFVFMAENKSLDQMTDAPASDPYLLQTIKPKSAWFTDYHSLATGSLSQYIAITSGQYAACQRKGPCGKFDVPSIFSQLGDGGWKAWMESMPSPCYPNTVGKIANQNYYKSGHNPALWYRNLFTGSPTPCSKNDVPAGTTGRDDTSRSSTRRLHAGPWRGSTSSPRTGATLRIRPVLRTERGSTQSLRSTTF